MFREFLPNNKGMLFDFKEEGIHGIWMKNTLISLDIIWLDEDFNITHIKESVPPCINEPCTTYKNTVPSRFVLEINSKKSTTLNLGEKGVLY